MARRLLTDAEVAERDAKAARGDRDTDEYGPFQWAKCAYCGDAYKHRGSKPICSQCYVDGGI